LAVGQ
jgi:magnesium-transporting ATPase (P-type)